MTSLFDSPVRAAVVPLPIGGLQGSGRAGERGVSLLEFFAVDDERPHAHAAFGGSGHETAAGEGEGSEGERRAHQVRVMIDAAREETAAETRRICELEADMRLAAAERAEQERAERLAAEFARDRQRYFAAAEAQVIRLALTVARRVLAAEVRATELHLLPVVRSALARIKDGSATVLHVPAAEADAWRRVWSETSESRVTVAADDRLGPGECALETTVGHVELGVETQLREIERGFDELMQRPGS